MDEKTVKKTSGTHKSKSRSAVTKDTKVVQQSDSTQSSNHSSRMHSNTTDTHTNDNIQKAVADRLSELQHLNSTGM